MESNNKGINQNHEKNSKNNLEEKKRFEKNTQDSFLKIKEKADKGVKESLDFAIHASQKIDKNLKETIHKTKESSFLKEVQEKTQRLKNMDHEEKERHKQKTVKILIKIRDTIFELFEKFVGRIRVGTQYGKSSIDLLSDLAKLKELGIITEEEFEEKKKQILDRI